MVGAAGVAHDRPPPGCCGEALGELGGRCARALQPQRERAHAADGEVGLERARAWLRPARGARAAGARARRTAATTAPSSRSEWPPRYFVAECTTRSAPSSSGRWTSGVANVLSTTINASGLRGAAQMAGRSATASSGLDGDSSHNRSASAASLEPARRCPHGRARAHRSLPGRGRQYPQHRRGLRCLRWAGRLLAEAPRPQAEPPRSTQE